MKIENNKISNGQILAIIVSAAIGVGILSLPRSLVETAGTDGWVLLIFSGIMVSIIVTIITKLTVKFSGKTLTEFGRDLLTTPLSDFVSVLYFIYLTIFTAFVVRIFAEIVKMFLLVDTPTEVIIITMLLATSYLCRGRIEEFGKMAVLLLPVIIIPILLMIVILIPNLDPTNILPVFRFEIKELSQGIINSIFAFVGYDLLLVFMCYSNEPKKALKYNLGAIAIITVIYLIVFFMSIMVFGQTETAHLIWPSMSLTEVVQFPGAFIENVQGIVMAQWSLVVFTTLAALLYASSLVLSKLFRGSEHKYFVLPTIPIVYIMSLIPDNLASAYEYVGETTNYLGVFIAVLLPIILFVITLFKKGSKKGSVKNE